MVRPFILISVIALLIVPVLSLNSDENSGGVLISQSSPRTISFSGYEWRVKQSSGRVGPGPNYFSNREEDVWADEEGLHLTISQRNGRWYATEVIHSESLGYGTYLFHTKGRVDLIDPNMIAGFFTWDTSAPQYSYRELDFEYAKWGNPNIRTNAQYVVQPCSQCPGCDDRCRRFQVELTDEENELTHIMTWEPKKVTFKTYRGKLDIQSLSDNEKIHEWSYSGDRVPPAGGENFRFNFWLLNGSAPLSGAGDAFTITTFEFHSEQSVRQWDTHR